ncbi:MAG: hypothetical protein J5I59_09990 [Saprospiraceae bacterium]|nr:hypothetical protein [Saprospiraceae bacterium]
MFTKYNINTSVNFSFCSDFNKNVNHEILNNPNNVLFLSLDVKIIKSISKVINNYFFKENNHFFFLGIVEDDAQQFPIINEILSESKCKIFILNNDLSDLKYILQATDIANISTNVQIFANSTTACDKVISSFSYSILEQVINIGISGTQSHLNNSSSIPKQLFDSYRLGVLLNNIELLTQPINYANIVVTDISVLKHSDIPGRKSGGTSGLSSENFNQIARSIGLSDCRITILTGLNQLDEPDDISADTLAQFIYYFADGVIQKNRTTLPPKFVRFTIDECLPYDSITFIKDEFNNVWHVEFPTKMPDHLASFQNVPCTYADYKFSSQGELSPRIIEIFNALDDLVN